MLFTEEQLQDSLNPFSILNEGVYLTQEESSIKPEMIAVKENNNLGLYIVDFTDIEKLSENDSLDYISALDRIVSTNNLQIDNIVVSINEEDMILNPDLINIGPVVIKPISENDTVYSLCEYISNLYLQIDDEILLEVLSDKTLIDIDTLRDKHLKRNNRQTWDAIYSLAKQFPKKPKSNFPEEEIERIIWKVDKAKNRRTEIAADRLKRYLSKKNKSDEPAGKPSTSSNNSSKFGTGTKIALGLGGAALVGGGIYAINKYRNQPKSVIAKKIASLRKIYSKWMQKAASSRDQGLVSKLKRGAAKILQVIDKLMALLQNKADGK